MHDQAFLAWERSLSSPKCPGRSLGPPILQLDEYCGRCPRKKIKWLLCKSDDLFPSSADHEPVEFRSTPTYTFIACTWTILPLLFPFSSLHHMKSDSFHPLLRNNIWCGKSNAPGSSCKQGQPAVCLLDRTLSRQIKRLMASSSYSIITSNIPAKPV